MIFYIAYLNLSIFYDSLLARKYLRIQASSAACERIFSFSGHIISIKRRLLGCQTFSDLVFLKPNENLLMDLITLLTKLNTFAIFIL